MKEFDKEFVLKLKKQDHVAFDQFYLKTVDMFFRYVKSHYFLNNEEIEDIISHYYIKQRDAFPKIDINKSFSAYFRTIFKNTLKDYFKKIKEISFSQILLEDDNDNSFDETLSDDFDIKEFLEKDYQIEQIKSAMQQLDDINKDIIYFRYIEGKSYQEITEILQISNDSIRQRHSRAIKQLKSLLS